jgi:hypothetical protein
VNKPTKKPLMFVGVEEMVNVVIDVTMSPGSLATIKKRH